MTKANEKNMERNIRINFEQKQIEVSGKAFIANAGKYNSEEYNFDKEVRSEFPDFSVVFVQSARKGAVKTGKAKSRGFTFKLIEEYIKIRPESEKALKTFENYRDGDETTGTDKQSYGTIMKWFFDAFPEVESADFCRRAIWENA